MDSKALAKSKRAHSLHHSKKHHPRQASKAPTVGSTTKFGGENSTGKQEREKTHHTGRASKALPSNWDRYEDEDDLGADDVSKESASQSAGTILPKSKGADYVYLISEAKAQLQTNHSSDNFPSFDDVLGEFNQGMGSLLALKGENIVSWTADDNFTLDDKVTAAIEAPFLSLNLHALAEQLAKAKLSERLFIKPGALPLEVFDKEVEASDSHISEWRSVRGVAGKDSNASTSVGTSEGSTNMQRSKSIDTTTSNNIQSAATQLEAVKNDKDQPLQFEGNVQGTLPFTSQTYRESITNEPSRFEVTPAETELDMLLNSFSETKFFESSSNERSTQESFIPQTATHTSFSGGFPSVPLVPPETDIERSTKLDINLDETLDDLLRETSAVNLSSDVPSDPSLLNQSVKEGLDIDKSTTIGINIDQTLDDLLIDTSIPINKDGGASSEQVKAVPQDIPSTSDIVSESTLLDDFDSWLDTI